MINYLQSLPPSAPGDSNPGTSHLNVQAEAWIPQRSDVVGVGTLASHGPAIVDAGTSPGRPSEPLYLQGSALPRSSVPASLRFFKDRRSLAAPFSLHLSSVLNFRLSLEITLSLVMFLFRMLLTFSRHQLSPRFIEADQPCGSAAYSAIVRRQL